MEMVYYTDGHGGLHRWTWWTAQINMVDYTDGDGGLHRWTWRTTHGDGGLHRWTWWTTQTDMVSICVFHHVDLCSPPYPSL
jgi:hypothetical protein